MFALIFLVSVVNIRSALAESHELAFLEVPAQQIVQTAQAIAPFTSTIEEDEATLVSLANGDEQGVLKKPEIPETILSPRTYTVAQGDSISTVAQKFGLTVATVLEANGLQGKDTTALSVGLTLNIPAENTSTSLAWLQEEQNVRVERERKARLVEQRRIASSSSRRVAIRGSSRDISDEGFDGEPTDDLVAPIRYHQQTRCARSYHPGSDLTADVGTPVAASDSGKVVEKTGGYGQGYGISVVIDHGGGVKTRYAHLSRTAVNLGEPVSQGQIVAYSGNTGFSTGPHLHFDKIVNGRNVRFCF